MPLLELDDSRQTYAESFRHLRSALLFLTPSEEERPRVLMVTSAMPDEGKSTIAVNLARTLAMGGARVLLIDADLRRGGLHESIGAPRLPGLTELLRQPATLPRVIQSQEDLPVRTGRRRRDGEEEEQAVQETRTTNLMPNLSFIPRGGDICNPGDLLLSPAFDQVIGRLRKQFDYVLIDTCPVFAADDATTMASRVDGTLLVVRRRYSRSRQVREALDVLYERQAKVLGLIFNRSDARARSYYYYTHTDYHTPVSTGA
jgi:succinoglycan biosynthesis transport protein ExoP